MEQNISQIVQKTQNLQFSVKISFSCLNLNNCPFPLHFKDEIIVYQVAQLCYEYNGRVSKLYPDIATVITRPCYFLPHSPLSKMLGTESRTRFGGCFNSIITTIWRPDLNQPA